MIIIIITAILCDSRHENKEKLFLLKSVNFSQGKIWAMWGNYTLHIYICVYYMYICMKRCEWFRAGIVIRLDSGAEGPGSNRSRDAVG